MRILCLGLDGADDALVRDLVAQGKLPTIGRLIEDGAFGSLRSTIPAMTPTAWSSFLTGLNPGQHGILNWETNPNRSVHRVESAASRSGTPFWRLLGEAGIRSAFVMVPFTYPPVPIEGILVTGYGGPVRPEIQPAEARERIFAAYPDLVTAHHPMRDRWWEDFGAYTDKLLAHVDETAGVCKLALELEPDLQLLCVDFMSSDFAGHLAWHRLDPTHPAHDVDGDEIVRAYQAIDRACGELIEEARRLYGEEPTTIVISDHGMKPTHWVFHTNRWLEENGYLRYRRRSLQPLRRGRLGFLAKVDGRLARTRRRYARMLDRIPFLPRPAEDRAFADIDFGSTRAYGFATGGQVYLGEASGARDDPRVADELAEAFARIPHPETGKPAFEVKRKDELFHGPHIDKTPELVLLPLDDRIHVDSSRWPWTQPFDRHERLDPEHFYGYSGHHGLYGILAAAGPGIRPGELPTGTAEITQMPATICRLLGITSDAFDGAPIDAILADDGRTATAVSIAPEEAVEAPVYSEEEEAAMAERLRDLGYE